MWIKGLSVTYYFVGFLHFIQSSPNSLVPQAVMTASIDMSKVSNHVDHSLCVIDLFDMHCPNWLLKIIISFLSNRTLVLHYGGQMSKSKNLPGGAPASSLFGGIIFIVKFNGVLLRPAIPRPTFFNKQNTHHDKYMDDIQASVMIQLKHLADDPFKRVKPLSYSERTEQILPQEVNMLQHLLQDIETFSIHNGMKVNQQKTKAMKFSRSKTKDFPLEVSFSNNVRLKVVHEFKLRGIIIQDDLKW